MKMGLKNQCLQVFTVRRPVQGLPFILEYRGLVIIQSRHKHSHTLIHTHRLVKPGSFRFDLF